MFVDNGALIVNWAPVPMPSLVAFSDPPKILAPMAHECSPNPWPCGFVVKPWLNSFLRFSGLMPMPVSLIWMLTDLSSC